AGFGPSRDLLEIGRVRTEGGVELFPFQVLALARKLLAELLKRLQALAGLCRVLPRVDAHLDARPGVGFLEEVSARDSVSIAARNGQGSRILRSAFRLHGISFQTDRWREKRESAG